MLVHENMPPAVILAGGMGKRLRPMTETTPKPLLPLVGKPILFHILDRLWSMGVTRAFVMTGYLGQKIERALESYGGEMQIECVREEAPLGSAGCFSLLWEKIENECFVVSGDAYFEFDLRPALVTMREKKAAAVLCLCRVESPTAFGMVNRERNGRISGFVEKPTWSRVQGDLANTGIYALGEGTFSYLKGRKAPLDFGADVFPALMEAGKALYGVISDGFWCDIGTPEAFRTCNLRLSGGKNVLGAGVELASTAVLSGAVLFDGVQVGAGATLKDCVVCENAIVANGVTVSRDTVVGAGAVIGDRALLCEGVLLPAGTIVPARAVLRADVNMQRMGHFADGKLHLRPNDAAACGKRVGRAVAALAQGRGTVAVMRRQSGPPSDFLRALCEGILAGGANLCDLGKGFYTAAAFAAANGGYVYTLFVEKDMPNVEICLLDADGLYPDARFERKFSDLMRSLPVVENPKAEMYTEKQVGRRYLDMLCLDLPPDLLVGMTVGVTGEDEGAVQMLERALHGSGALLSSKGDVKLRLLGQGGQVCAEVYGMEVGYWQIAMVLALEQVKKGQAVFLSYLTPETIKRAVSASGGRAVFYTLYPENGREESIRAQLWRKQPWVVDGLAAAMAFVALLASGKLRASELGGICEGFATSEAMLLSDDGTKMRVIRAHKGGFDGEGLLCRYRKGNVRVVPQAGDAVLLSAEAASLEDARELIERAKKEFFKKNV